VTWEIRQGDALEVLRTLDAGTVQCCVTSPPYWSMLDYDTPGQLGLEPRADCCAWARGADLCAECYVCAIVRVFQELHRVLRDDGTLWLDLGDTFVGGRRGIVGANTSMNGSRRNHMQSRKAQDLHGARRLSRVGMPAKNLIGLPWRVAFALQAVGWYLRTDIIWEKPSCLPEGVRDRPTRSHEYLFLLTKKPRYFYDAGAISEPLMHASESTAADVARAFSRKRGAAAVKRQDDAEIAGPMPTTRNKRSVWRVASQPFAGEHAAIFPPNLVLPCILAGSRPGDLVLDPFSGAGTTIMVALRNQRRALGIELNPAYIEIAKARIIDDQPLFNSEPR